MCQSQARETLSLLPLNEEKCIYENFVGWIETSTASRHICAFLGGGVSCSLHKLMYKTCGCKFGIISTCQKSAFWNVPHGNCNLYQGSGNISSKNVMTYSMDVTYYKSYNCQGEFVYIHFFFM